MELAEPPDGFEGAPIGVSLPAGAILTRIHSISFGAEQFNPTLIEEGDKTEDSGRFNSTPADPYAYLYAADNDETAVSEMLLRDVGTGNRMLVRKKIRNLRISWIRAKTDLMLVDLTTGIALGAIGADTRLTTVRSGEYYMTQKWSIAIRKWADWAQGLVWTSLREPAGLAYVFFDDRCPTEAFGPAPSDSLPIPEDDRDLADGAGHEYVNGILERYRVGLEP